MDYRVEQLATAAGVGVDTVRFYQARGLLPAPRREGRVAVYDDGHLDLLRRIRSLQERGFSLDQIRCVLARPGAESEEALLGALLEERLGARTFRRQALAAEAGVPEAMVRAAESAGLLEPMRVDGEERFSEADVEMARTGLALLEAGVPLQSLLELSVRHAGSIQRTCDEAIELFDAHVRKGDAGAVDEQTATRVFRSVLPQVTRLVALHFQRTLLSRALARLRGRDEHRALAAALEATEAGRLEVEVTWR